MPIVTRLGREEVVETIGQEDVLHADEAFGDRLDPSPTGSGGRRSW